MYSSGQSVSSQPENSVVAPHGDAELVACLLRRDRKATADFVSLYSDCVYVYIRSRLAPRYDQVEDLVQEVFLAAWQGLAQYRATGPLQAWILGIARHRVEDYYRESLRLPESITESEEEFPPFSAALEVQPQIQQFLEQAELRAKAQRILQGLPEPYRLALMWRYWHETPARAMASKTGKTEKAIERLLSRARAEFRERWIHV